jgi:hypothetical protein
VPPLSEWCKTDGFSQLRFNLTLDCTARKVQENKEGLKLNLTHQLLVCASDVILFEENINIVNKKKINWIHVR